MDDWIDYYDSTHTIYASKLHRDLHFEVIARDIVGYITSPNATVLDYACGEALSAARVADACGKLILAEPAPGVRGRLISRFAPDTRIRVRSLDDLRKMEEKSVDLAVMNSVQNQALIGLTGDDRRPALAAASGGSREPKVELSLELRTSPMAVEAIRFEDRPDVPLESRRLVFEGERCFDQTWIDYEDREDRQAENVHGCPNNLGRRIRFFWLNYC